MHGVFKRVAAVCGAGTAGLVALFFFVPGGPCAVNLDFLALAIPAFIATCVFGALSGGLGPKLDRLLGWFDGTTEVRVEQRRLLQQRLNGIPPQR